MGEAVGAEAEDAAVAIGAMVDRLDYPMFVVTAADDGERSGCLAGFVTQCSIEPPRFLVCVSKANHTYPAASSAPTLGLHLLGADQHDLASLFGELTGDRSDKFKRVAWRPGPGGAPILAECAAWLEGRVLERVDLGDHVGHLLDPFAGGPGPRPGELRMAQVRDLEAGHPTTSGEGPH